MSHYGDDGEKVIHCIVHGLDKAGKSICNVDHARDWALGSSHPLAIKIGEEKAVHASGTARDVSQSTPAARRLRALTAAPAVTVPPRGRGEQPRAKPAP